MRELIPSLDKLEQAVNRLADVLENKEPKSDIKISQIRAIFNAKNAEGKAQELKNLLSKYGVPNLTAVKPADYASILKDAEAL